MTGEPLLSSVDQSSSSIIVAAAIPAASAMVERKAAAAPAEALGDAGAAAGVAVPGVLATSAMHTLAIYIISLPQ